MKNIFTLLVILICVVCCLPPAANAAAKVGDVIEFGDWNWRVLDVQDGKLLIITENSIEQRPYNVEQKEVTWETCTLRKYLNGEFYAKFSKEEQGRIAETKISNPNNPEHGANGGNDTTDKIFLLSIEEARKYFSSDSARIAKYNNATWYWWLRSPGHDSLTAASVDYDGNVYVYGDAVHDIKSGPYGGVRPALFLEVK